MFFGSFVSEFCPSVRFNKAKYDINVSDTLTNHYTLMTN